MVGGALVLVEGVVLIHVVGVALGLVVGVAFGVVGGAQVLVGLSDGSAVMVGRDVRCYTTCNPASTRNRSLTFIAFCQRNHFMTSD